MIQKAGENWAAYCTRRRHAAALELQLFSMLAAVEPLMRRLPNVEQAMLEGVLDNAACHDQAGAAQVLEDFLWEHWTIDQWPLGLAAAIDNTELTCCYNGCRLWPVRADNIT